MKNISNFKRRESNNFPYIIAEIGVNHECSLSRAKKLIDLAANAGASAAKFQTYKAEKLASKNSPSYWDTKKEKTLSQFKLFKKFDKFDYKHYKKLFHHCKKKRIDFASTPFDVDSVNFLNPFLKYFKVASADINNLPLLKAIGKKRKPVILSTGASYINEIKFALRYLKKFGCPKIVIMHCILNYPTEDKNANLNMIDCLKKNFPGNTIGYSDHTLPDKNMLNLTTAYFKGATIIEKHFTDNKNKKGNDHYHSMDNKDLKVFLKNIKKIQILLGNSSKKPIKSEFISRKNARRSIVTNENLEKGKKLNEKNLTTKRPGTGITPEKWNKIIGKRLTKNVPSDHVLRWSDIK
tara:strand:- start:26810 stop:27862 length:1053 start_codon:yes stop_codon:yes gene_type:complete